MNFYPQKENYKIVSVPETPTPPPAIGYMEAVQFMSLCLLLENRIILLICKFILGHWKKIPKKKAGTDVKG